MLSDTKLTPTREFLTKNMDSLLHSSYSSDLAPVDFPLLPKIKMLFKGRHLNIDVESQSKSQAIRLRKTIFKPDLKNSRKVGTSVLLRKATILK